MSTDTRHVCTMQTCLCLAQCILYYYQDQGCGAAVGVGRQALWLLHVADIEWTPTAQDHWSDLMMAVAAFGSCNLAMRGSGQMQAHDDLVLCHAVGYNTLWCTATWSPPLGLTLALYVSECNRHELVGLHYNGGNRCIYACNWVTAAPSRGLTKSAKWHLHSRNARDVAHVDTRCTMHCMAVHQLPAGAPNLQNDPTASIAFVRQCP
jgi:hypothetical protein